MKIIGSSNSKNLALELCGALKLSPTKIDIQKFPSGEYLTRLYEPISSKEKLVIVGSMPSPSNDSLMEIMSIINAACNAGAENITLVIPYLGYSRQDIMQAPYSSVGITMLAKMFDPPAIRHLITVDIHSEESLKLFSMPVTHISISDILGYYKHLLPDATIIAPDKGSAKRLSTFSGEIVTMNKRRNGDSIEMELGGDVAGKDCLIIDDIFDSGKTMLAAVECLEKYGAGKIWGYCTHFLGGGKPLIPLYTTNSISLTPLKKNILNIFSLKPLICRYL